MGLIENEGEWKRYSTDLHGRDQTNLQPKPARFPHHLIERRRRTSINPAEVNVISNRRGHRPEMPLARKRRPPSHEAPVRPAVPTTITQCCAAKRPIPPQRGVAKDHFFVVVDGGTPLPGGGVQPATAPINTATRQQTTIMDRIMEAASPNSPPRPNSEKHILILTVPALKSRKNTPHNGADWPAPRRLPAPPVGKVCPIDRNRPMRKTAARFTISPIGTGCSPVVLSERARAAVYRTRAKLTKRR